VAAVSDQYENALSGYQNTGVVGLGNGFYGNAMGGSFLNFGFDAGCHYHLESPIATVKAGIYWKYAGPRRHSVLVIPQDGVARGTMDIAVYSELQDFGALGSL
jgi:hypothetical protein